MWVWDSRAKLGVWLRKYFLIKLEKACDLWIVLRLHILFPTFLNLGIVWCIRIPSCTCNKVVFWGGWYLQSSKTQISEKRLRQFVLFKCVNGDLFGNRMDPKIIKQFSWLSIVFNAFGTWEARHLKQALNNFHCCYMCNNHAVQYDRTSITN
jgi:hypothetical protein